MVVASLTAVVSSIVTPGSPAPVWSTTFPTIEPVWAAELLEAQTKMHSTRRCRPTEDIVRSHPHYGRNCESDWVVRDW
jgi:hypothetical protein